MTLTLNEDEFDDENIDDMFEAYLIKYTLTQRNLASVLTRAGQIGGRNA